MILFPESDPIGQAVSNFYFQNDNTPIKVFSRIVEDEDMPPEYFFRKYNDMPLLERLALKNCEGKVLDVGAGAGCHSVWLQSKKIDVTALELSQLCCNVLKNRGILKVENSSILDYNQAKFDTILLLMNGIGIASTLNGLTLLLEHLKTLLNDGGKILLDSSDLIYLYEQDDGTFLVDISAENYYGEIEYQLSYKNIEGNNFSWLFADQIILSDIADKIGFNTKILEYGPHYNYLAELTIR